MERLRSFSNLRLDSSWPSRLLVSGALCLGVMLVGCQDDPDSNVSPSSPASSAAEQTQTAPSDKPDYGEQQPSAITFKDQANWAQAKPLDISDLVFKDKNGKEIRLSDFEGKKNVVLVFTKGFIGMLCPFCQTQTSRLIGNYEKFQQRDTEILVVYPGEKDRLPDFIDAALNVEKKQVELVPFPIVLDEAYLAADFFEIRKMSLVHPSTFIIDKDGSVQLAYVGEDMTADRPSVSSILKSIDAINQK